jgi:hypothetical protein
MVDHVISPNFNINAKTEIQKPIDPTTRVLNAIMFSVCPGITDVNLIPPTIKQEAWQFYMFLNAATNELQNIGIEEYKKQHALQELNNSKKQVSEQEKETIKNNSILH